MATQQHSYAIDTHVHVFRRTAPWMAWLEDRPQRWDAVRRDFAWAHLTAVLDESGIDDLVLVQAGMTPDESVELLRLAAEQPRVRGVVGWATLGSPRETEIQLDRLAAVPGGKLVGIRNNHGWPPDGDALTRPPARDALRLIAERDLAIDLHFADETEVLLALPHIEALPEARFVIDHLGKPRIESPQHFEVWATSMSILAEHPGVYVKYSGWATFSPEPSADRIRPYIEHVLDCFGADRTMYASNWPVALVAGDYATTLAATMEAVSGISERDRAALMAGTAAACYRLVPRTGERS
jgi:L-fuconolactonase